MGAIYPALIRAASRDLPRARRRCRPAGPSLSLRGGSGVVVRAHEVGGRYCDAFATLTSTVFY
eukprot:8388841-Alexandrium_andersonii.AAC.1